MKPLSKMPNYYEILGISKDANELEIKKAYRTLSMVHHPDRGGDTHKFQEMSSAYETLKDPQKRAQYDAELNGVHMNPFGGGVPGGFPFPFGPGANVHFAHMGGGGGSAEFADLGSFINMMFHGGGMPNIGRPVPIVRNIRIPLEQAYTGTSVPLEIERWVMRDPHTREMEKETVYVQLPAGIDDNEVVILQNKGNVINENVKGDVKVVVQIDNTTPFRRQGLDLVYPKTISLKESLCGFLFSIVHLNGKQLTFNNTGHNTIIKPNSKKVIPNMGMTRNGNSGNLIIDFEIEFPDTLSPEQTAALSIHL